jgi:glycopeptide antibiotics resistance protein
VRLGRAILGYLAAVTLIITLAPFRFASAPVHGITDIWNWSDIVLNILMFVPIGFVYQLTRPARATAQWLHAFFLGAALSGIIEFAQLFEATRYTSLIDVLTNAAGAALGAWVFSVVVWRIEGARTVRTLALELPLMGLLYLLIPLVWLQGLGSAGGSRMWLVLPVLAFGGAILGTVHAAYVSEQGRANPTWLLVAAAVWFIVALLPGTIRDRELLLAGAALVLGVAWLRSVATTRYRDADASRRFELPTLRLVLPLFAAYLALSSLWPLQDADGSWSAMGALLPGHDVSKAAIFVALEHVAAFTLVGYIIAEFHGRDLERYRDIADRVLLWGGGISVLLELARGFHPAYRASGLMVAFTVGAAVFGGWLYQLQRDHVRALITRRNLD